MEPPIHFDTLMGINPSWRRAISQALQGDNSALKAEMLLVRSISPASYKALQCAFEYARWGQQVFCVGPRLQRMFDETDAARVPAEFLQLPYGCFYVSLPNCPWELYGGPRTGMHQCGGMYIHQVQDLHWTFVIWGIENEMSEEVGDDATFWLDVNLDSAPRTKQEDGQEVLDLDALIQNILAGGNDVSDPGLDFPEDDLKESFRGLPHLFRVAFNLILYINSLNAETDKDNSRQQRKQRRREVLNRKLRKIKNEGKREKKRRQIEEELLKFSEAHVVWIGKSIEQIPEKVQGQKVASGTWRFRRGHWHSYWVGPRKIKGQPRFDPEGNRVYGDRKVLRWVTPVQRDMASVVASRSRHYRFREEKKDWKDGEKKR